MEAERTVEAVTVSKNKYVGRPPKFRTKEEIQEKIDAYFKECDGELLMDDNGNPVCTPKTGLVYIKQPKPPTVTGLALALGFASRQSLMEYQGKKEFADTIIRAKSRIEEYAEARLFDRDGVNGAKFSLINNFRGWGEKPEQEQDTGSNMVALAEILMRPGKNRNIHDFEGDDEA
ncbi:terminase small subunit [Anaerotignum sp.]|uniref:terminase small subunit n=1 Tax=Anaerotignum sp. TaxID=2039241 RepID=UPI003A8A997B